MLEQLPALFAVVDHTGIGYALWQWSRRPGAPVVELQAKQEGAAARLGIGTTLRLVQGGWGQITDTEAFAVRLQALAQQAVAGQVEVQAQCAFAGLPAP